MNIQISTDSHINNTPELRQQVETEVENAMKRFGDRVTRVDVHLADQNSSQKFSDRDKRCLLEARLAGLDPVAVSHEGETMAQAISGAADKLVKTLDRTIGRLSDS